jgi:hypothetical protein
MKATAYFQLQERYGGQFIAHQDGKVLAAAPSYDELCRRLEELELGLELDWDRVMIEYIEPADAAHVY